MSDPSSPREVDVERSKPPGEPRSWERREEPSVASEKRWARLGKSVLYAVWITVLLIVIVVIVAWLRNPPR